MKRELYVMIGDNQREWAESPPLGPFESEAKAREAIRDDLNHTLDGCESLSPGVNDNWPERYTIISVVKAFSPKINVDVRITLPINKQSDQ